MFEMVALPQARMPTRAGDTAFDTNLTLLRTAEARDSPLAPAFWIVCLVLDFEQQALLQTSGVHMSQGEEGLLVSRQDTRLPVNRPTLSAIDLLFNDAIAPFCPGPGSSNLAVLAIEVVEDGGDGKSQCRIFEHLRNDVFSGKGLPTPVVGARDLNFEIVVSDKECIGKGIGVDAIICCTISVEPVIVKVKGRLIEIRNFDSNLHSGP